MEVTPGDLEIGADEEAAFMASLDRILLEAHDPSPPQAPMLGELPVNQPVKKKPGRLKGSAETESKAVPRQEFTVLLGRVADRAAAKAWRQGQSMKLRKRSQCRSNIVWML